MKELLKCSNISKVKKLNNTRYMIRFIENIGDNISTLYFDTKLEAKQYLELMDGKHIVELYAINKIQ